MKSKKSFSKKRETLSENLRLISDETVRLKVSTVLLDYFAAESFYKQLLISKNEAEGKKLTEKEKKSLKVDVKTVQKVLKFFEVSFNIDIIKRTFGSEEKSYSACSVKKLRDRLVHCMNKKAIETTVERYDGICGDLGYFFGLFGIKRQ